jgi:hypothetical protein
MSSITTKAVVSAGALVVAAIAGYWYWSPYLAIRQMQTAANENDADAFNKRVDYSKLRESLKGQFSAMLTEQLGTAQGSGNDFAKAGTAFGTMLGLAMVNTMVDALVRPETVMRAMHKGQMSPKGVPPTEGSTSPAVNQGAPAATTPNDEKPGWSYERKGADKLIAYANDPSKPEATAADKFGVVLQRTGFADWKLTEIRLPTLAK